jgi:hypothetical protein
MRTTEMIVLDSDTGWCRVTATNKTRGRGAFTADHRRPRPLSSRHVVD